MNNYLIILNQNICGEIWEKLLIVKRIKDFLKNQVVKLYHIYSEPKVSIAERMIITLKEKCEKV